MQIPVYEHADVTNFLIAAAVVTIVTVGAAIVIGRAAGLGTSTATRVGGPAIVGVVTAGLMVGMFLVTGPTERVDMTALEQSLEQTYGVQVLDRPCHGAGCDRVEVPHLDGETWLVEDDDGASECVLRLTGDRQGRLLCDGTEPARAD